MLLKTVVLSWAAHLIVCLFKFSNKQHNYFGGVLGLWYLSMVERTVIYRTQWSRACYSITRELWFKTFRPGFVFMGLEKQLVSPVIHIFVSSCSIYLTASVESHKILIKLGSDHRPWTNHMRKTLTSTSGTTSMPEISNIFLGIWLLMSWHTAWWHARLSPRLLPLQ